MSKSLRYSDAGVDVGVWNQAKDRIGELVSSTYNSGVLGKFGQFGGMFDLSAVKELNPVLVSSTDSVGTKVKIVFEMGVHNSIGQDIVNHCVNDILVLGARPLFFLDYIGINKLVPEIALQIVEGLAGACKANNCVLIGGETAEMPDVYSKGEYDLVGCIVGVVDKEKVIDGSSICSGDVLIGLRSNGLHTNGYSLARKIVREVAGKQYTDIFEPTGRSFGLELLKPHRSYLSIWSLLEKGLIKGCAHITGGGFQDNVNRMLPENCNAVVNAKAWTPDPMFQFLQKSGNVENDEMYRTFNMGIGMVMAVAKENADMIMNASELSGYDPVKIGYVASGTGVVNMEF